MLSSGEGKLQTKGNCRRLGEDHLLLLLENPLDGFFFFLASSTLERRKQRL